MYTTVDHDGVKREFPTKADLKAFESRQDQLYRQAIFDLHATLNVPGSDWFSTHVFKLIFKADRENQRRIARAFPLHWRVWTEWKSAPDKDAYLSGAHVREKSRAGD